MQVIVHPQQNEWANFLKRPYADNSAVFAAAQGIIEEVKKRGDAALLQFAKSFDGVDLDRLAVSEAEIAAAEKEVSPELKTAILPVCPSLQTILSFSGPASMFKVSP